MAFPALTIVAVGVLLFLAAIRLLYRAALPKPIPGIPYNASAITNLFGDVPSFLQHHKSEPTLHPWILQQCKNLNSPIVQLFMRPFSRPWVIVTDSREAHDIMTRRTKDFDRSNFFGDLFISLLPSFQAHMRTDDEWRAHRRLMGDVMTPAFLNESASPKIFHTVQDLIQLWREKSRLAEGRPFLAKEDVFHAVLDIIWASTFGSDIGVLESHILNLQTTKLLDPLSTNINEAVIFPGATKSKAFESIIHLTHTIEMAMNSPFPRQYHSFALNFYPSLISARKHKDELIKNSLDTAWKKLSAKDASESHKRLECAVDLVVQREILMARKEGRRPDYNIPAIKDELFGFLVAGHDTIATTVCWGIKFLTANTAMQASLRSALKSTFRRAADSHTSPTAQDIAKADIPYLNATIEEVHRCGKAASAVIRRATCDTNILGYHVPKGTDVFLETVGPSYLSAPFEIDESKRSVSSIDNKSKYGSWDVESIGRFMPERWLSTSEKGLVQFNPRAGPMHAFGAGARACFGRKLATLELKMVFTLLVWNFELLPTPADLSSFDGKDILTYEPLQCYARLKEL